jgi:hypothetical protein
MGSTAAQFGTDMRTMMAQNPGASEALTDMGKEMQKIKGVPVLEITRMGTTLNGEPLPAASEAPLPPDNTPAMPSGRDIAKQSAASAISSRLGALGGFGGFGKKKQAPPPDPDANAAATPTVTILMESQTTTSNFSSAEVDPSHFDVPAGFKQIQPQGLR